MLRAGGATAAAAFAPHLADAQVVVPVRPPSPPTSLWAQELPVQRPIRPESGLSPNWTVEATGDECGRVKHQAIGRFPPQEVYRVEVKTGKHIFHPQLPEQEIWGYNGEVPGPLFHARYGKPILVRFENKLPQSLQGFGSPDISVHLHNLHTPSESDGFTARLLQRHQDGPDPDRLRCVPRPLLSEPLRGLRRDGRHRRPARGAGDALVPRPPGGLHGPQRLPRHGRLLPGVRSHRQRERNRSPAGAAPAQRRGKIQPFFKVARRKYRFRILNAGVSRTIDLQVRLQNRPQEFMHIANDGNLFEAPIKRTNVQLGVAERADIVIDFAAFPRGSEVILVNRLKQLDGTKPEKDFLATPIPILKFDVERDWPGEDPSRVPAFMREQPKIDLTEVVRTREFSFSRTKGSWAINDKLFDGKPIANPKKGTAEIWNLRNLSGGWAHPIHIHFEEGRILKRNGGDPPPWEKGRKDVYFIGPNESVSVFLRFRDFTGKYIMHCHNTIHEDHAMMGRYDIES
jgi:FtsP/CotA-like multicopper oxidase with cupredoxin domain